MNEAANSLQLPSQVIDSARSLGIILNEKFNMQNHINAATKGENL